MLKHQNGGGTLRDEASQRSAGKRPCRTVTLHDKLVAIKRVHEGETKASVARYIGVPESTLRGWCKNIKKLIQQAKDANNKDRASLSTTTDSDRSTPNSSSRSPPSGSNLTSMLGSGEEGESIGNILRRPNTEAELVPSSSTAMSTPRQYSEPVRENQFLTPLYHTLMSSSPERMLEQIAQFNLKNNLMSYFNSYSTLNPTLNPSLLNQSIQTFLHNKNGGSLSNIMPNGPTLTKPRKPNTLTLASDHQRLIQNVSPRNHPYKRPKSSSPTERPRSNGLSPIPSTSGLSNGHATATSPKPFKSDGKKIDGIVQHLRQQQQQQQGQPQKLHVQVQQDLCAGGQTTPVNNNRYNILHNQMLSDNSYNNTNNNNRDDSDNSNVQDNESKPPRGLPPGINEALENGVKYLQWLENHGSAIFTFRDVKPIKMTVDMMTKWANNTLDQGPKRASNIQS